ncbi:MAG: HAMP domain-containing histidine kinase [Acutalibacter sp.]|nr:HAMP domain-containing histidine kinase [Acutalibacter sp.]
MATKSKNTSLFRGLVSWVCLMITLLGIAGVVAALVVGAVDSYLQARIASLLSELSLSQQMRYEYGVQLLSILGLCLAVVLPVFLFRKDRRALEEDIARWLSKIWIEVKLLAIFFSLFYSIEVTHRPEILVSAGIFILYFLCLDIGHNRSPFSHNIIHSILKALNSYRGASTFQKCSMRKLYSCIGVIFGVILISFFLFLMIGGVYGPIRGFFVIGTIGFAIAGVVGTILWFTFSYRRDLRDWSALMAQIGEMYDGNLDAVNHVLPTSNLYHCAMQLNMIRIGIQKAVNEGIKADRTKVELITNVSHDIKTPLTSIISYIELIKKEPDLPPLVMDYVNTISQKAQRLSAIVQDVFEVSKAATGNISLDMEDLDIGKLLHQTFGEMEETLESAPLTWRVDIPDTPVMIHADGQRLYRVFQNLLRNCTQYSLEGSRVYAQLSAQNGNAVVSIRNISRNEITMNGEDLTARFVRGDQNRTTEGSGLGLSIAKSFTEACGGQFAVYTDGDVFTAVVQFPLVLSAASVPRQVLETAPPQEDFSPPAAESKGEIE